MAVITVILVILLAVLPLLLAVAICRNSGKITNTERKREGIRYDH